MSVRRPGQIRCDKVDIHGRSGRTAMLTAQRVFHVQIVRTTRENDAGIGMGGGRGLGGRGNGGFEEYI